MTRREVGRGLVATISRHESGVRLTVRVRSTRRRVAVVEGSEAFVRRALKAVGLFAVAPAPVARLSKHGDRAGLPLVSGKPAHGDL